MKLSITHIDTACVLLNINGFKILTDPVLDKAGKLYYHGSGAFSRKTGNPAFFAGDLQDIDLVLLSHHQHKDNFDTEGKKFTATVPLVLTTKAGAGTLNNAIGLDNWEYYAVETRKVPGLKITATPAQHHPWWVPEFIAGKVIGFMIESDVQRKGALYISGDTVYFKGIDEIAKRFKVDIGVFHMGAVQFKYLTGFGRYTMNGKDLLKSATLINPNKIIPIHYRGWSHFTEQQPELKKVIDTDENISRKTIYLQAGIATLL